MQFYHKRKNLLFFDEDELKKIFEDPFRKRFEKLILESGYTNNEFRKDHKRIEEIVNQVEVKKKEEIEVFSAAYLYLKFFPENSKIGFQLKDSFDPRKNKISTFDSLKDAVKENDIVDFYVADDSSVRAFQLKAYTGNLNSEEFCKKIKQILAAYGNNLGSANLLITLRSGGEIPFNFFETTNKYLSSLSLQGKGHIMISYNEDNKFDVMKNVYPHLGAKRIPLV